MKTEPERPCQFPSTCSGEWYGRKSDPSGVDSQLVLTILQGQAEGKATIKKSEMKKEERHGFGHYPLCALVSSLVK